MYFVLPQSTNIMPIGDKFMSKGKTACETCAYYAYDDEYDCYFCEMSLDEDEMLKFLQSSFDNCPYYRFGDEYSIVRKQN